MGPYILDSYCSAARLAIEIDGYSHGVEGAEDHDARRDAYLNKLGILRVRLSNQLVREDLTAALDTILAEVRRRISDGQRGKE